MRTFETIKRMSYARKFYENLFSGLTPSRLQLPKNPTTFRPDEAVGRRGGWLCGRHGLGIVVVPSNLGSLATVRQRALESR